ncbi:Reverse transcriptase Ty1/copia-type domain-containing protein [Durusdinium trenchii]|uniref:Reverse transcriptase Ty1/copia-type domain-containing protein n=1 Tax=Durusdinium trenchii TaxID=1381693 RepID=A0ABP0RQ73_9DINO
MKVKLRDLPSPEVLPFKVMDAEAKEVMDYHEAHPDSDEEYTPSIGGRADDREAQDESASKKARTDDGPDRGSNELMDANDAEEKKKHGLEDKEEQPPKHYKHRQRNAALRWSEHFKELVEKMNFESYKGMPTVFKRSTRKMFLMIHVDDVLVASGIEDGTWFSKMVRKQLTMNAEGPFEYGSNNTFYYLKKKVVLARQGIFVQPNPSCIKKMVELLELHGKKTKTLPHHSNLEVYDKDNIKEHERLNAEDQRMFRSGIMQRAGQGKLKHIHIRNLWIQDLVREKIVRLLRVPTAINPADLNTKKLAQERRKKLMSLIPMGNQNGVEIETIETIPREVTQKTIQKILRVIFAGSTCFLQGCTDLTLQSGEMTVNDIITIRNLVILALTLVILYLTNALRATIQEQQQREEAVPEEPEEPSPEDTLMEKDMVTQKKEMEDLDAEYTMRHHMEQQILIEKKINYIMKENDHIPEEINHIPEKIDHITEKIDHILEEKFDEFNDDYQIPLISDEDVMETEEKIMTVDQKRERRELGNQDDNNALLRYLPPEADAVDNDVTMEYVDVDDINVIETGRLPDFDVDDDYEPEGETEAESGQQSRDPDQPRSGQRAGRPTHCLPDRAHSYWHGHSE